MGLASLELPPNMIVARGIQRHECGSTSIWNRGHCMQTAIDHSATIQNQLKNNRVSTEMQIVKPPLVNPLVFSPELWSWLRKIKLTAQPVEALTWLLAPPGPGPSLIVCTWQ